MLHVYHDETDWIIAESSDDAVRVWEETVGDQYDDGEHGPLEQLSDDELLTVIYFHDVDLPSTLPEGAKVEEREDGGAAVKATCRAWCDAVGRSWLSSTEF